MGNKIVNGPIIIVSILIVYHVYYSEWDMPRNDSVGEVCAIVIILVIIKLGVYIVAPPSTQNNTSTH